MWNCNRRLDIYSFSMDDFTNHFSPHTLRVKKYLLTRMCEFSALLNNEIISPLSTRSSLL